MHRIPAFHRHPGFRPRLVAWAAGLLLAGSVFAQEAPKAISINAQPLDKAIAALARQTGAQIVYATAAVEAKSAPAVRGTLTVREALQQLLAGSGLVLRAQDDQTFTVVRAEQQGALPTVTVAAGAEQPTATGPVRRYAARLSASATKMDTPLLETPQSITVVGAEQIADQKAQSVTEALAYAPGVMADPGYSNSYDVLYSRGFRLQDGNGGVYRDGLKLGGSGWATGQQEPYGLERIELLKGAASVLYGATAPGGVLNVVTKQPQQDPVNEVIAEGGNYQHRALAADLGRKLSDEWAARLVVLARNADTVVDHIPNNTRYIAPSLRWTPNAETSLTLQAHHVERRTAYVWGVPVVGTLLPSPHGKLPRDRFVGEPGFDHQNTTQSSFSWLLTHKLAEGLSLHHGLRWIDSENHIGFTNLRGPDPADSRVYQRRAFDELETTRGVSADTRIQAEFDTAGVRHKAVVGFDLSNHRIGSRWQLASLSPLNLFEPVYGATPGSFALAFDDREHQRRVGFYLQDQIKLGALTALAGLRRDEVNSTLNGESEKTGATTGRIGLVWELAPGLAPFASWSQSFEPVSGTDNEGQRYKPTRGEQAELGIRWMRGEFMVSAALFDLTQTNVLKNRPGLDKSVQTGEVRSRGLELEAKGPIARNVHLIASYAYTDAKTTQSERPSEIGQPVSYQPRHQAALWTRFDHVLTPGLQLGVGARYVGNTSDWGGTGAGVPSFTTLDLLIGYTTGPWTMRLNINNLANKTTLLCTGGWCTYGDGRRATASVAYRW